MTTVLYWGWSIWVMSRDIERILSSDIHTLPRTCLRLAGLCYAPQKPITSLERERLTQRAQRPCLVQSSVIFKRCSHSQDTWIIFLVSEGSLHDQEEGPLFQQKLNTQVLNSQVKRTQWTESAKKSIETKFLNKRLVIVFVSFFLLL